MARLRSNSGSAGLSRARITAQHPHLRYPDEQPLLMDRVVLGLPREARALVFVIFFLACLLLAGSLLNLMLRSAPGNEAAAPTLESQIQQSENAVPRT
jgi:hypothetical protein